MSYEMGFIGTGNMGSALAIAAAKSGGSMLLTDYMPEKARELAEKLGADSGTTEDVVRQCRYIFLGVKPQVLPGVLAQIAPMLCARQDAFTVVSMAAGVPIAKIKASLGESTHVIRIMPNLPAALGEGVILIAGDGVTTQEEVAGLEHILAGAGLLMRMGEDKIDAGCAISGSGPAYVYAFLEALADGAVYCGLPQHEALQLAAQTLVGAAKTVLASGRHPGILKAEVSSPAGTTIAGVRALEEGGFRAAAMNAVIAGYERAKELAK